MLKTPKILKYPKKKQKVPARTKAKLRVVISFRACLTLEAQTPSYFQSSSSRQNGKHRNDQEKLLEKKNS